MNENGAENKDGKARKVCIKQGDVVAVSQKLEANTFDGCLFDGPYGLTSIGKRSSKPPKTDEGLAAGFMHQTWDSGVPSAEACREFLRVCKPGSWMVAFGHPRTFHRLMCNIEDAGWEIRDTLMWVYGTGFPKSHDLGKKMKNDAWKGYGFALKPGYEPAILAMKPLDGSFVNNARKWGVAGLNIDGCRIGHDNITINRWKDGCKPFGGGAGHSYAAIRSEGRFPANVIMDEKAAHLLDLQSPISKGGNYRKSGERDRCHKGQQLYGGGIGGGKQNAPDCYGDAGGASRFFYCAKASHRERNAGLEDFPIDRPDKRNGKGLGIWDEKGIQPQQNHHPCVKPIALNKWLATLILPPERSKPRRLLVPYCGSGSEMIGSMLAGWNEVIGIEQDRNYIDIARARIKRWRSQQ
jgi:site-specific DNA-methyltransferase (adenine-specific)